MEMPWGVRCVVHRSLWERRRHPWVVGRRGRHVVRVRRQLASQGPVSPPAWPTSLSFPATPPPSTQSDKHNQMHPLSSIGFNSDAEHLQHWTIIVSRSFDSFAEQAYERCNVWQWWRLFCADLVQFLAKEMQFAHIHIFTSDLSLWFYLRIHRSECLYGKKTRFHD